MRALIRFTITLVLALAGLAVLAPAPAQATDTFLPNDFKVSGWWNQMNKDTSGLGDAEVSTRYFYNNFPLACSSNAPAGSSFYQALWIYPQGSTSVMNASAVKEAIAAASSAFSASAHKIIASQAGLESDLAPRWVTGTACNPTVTQVAVPVSVSDLSVDAPGGLWAWLDANGYNDAHTKYVSFLQHRPAAATYGGLTQVSYDYNTPGPENHINAHSHVAIINGVSGYSSASQHWQYISGTLAHEMAHSVGGVENDQPHMNSQNYGHPSDCFDVLCYLYGSVGGQNYLTACGWVVGGGAGDQQQFASKYSHRLDCNDDDYFTTATTGWPTTRWNGAKSAYLWGGVPQTAANIATRGGYSPGFSGTVGGEGPILLRPGFTAHGFLLPWLP